MTKKIFLIDDDPDDRDLFCEAIKEVAPEIICNTAANGRQSMVMLDDKKIETPDLIFLGCEHDCYVGLAMSYTVKGEG